MRNDSVAPVDARSFHPAGNGITDDSAALQAAIDAADNGRVFIPSGTYGLGSPLVYRDGVTVEGTGRTTVLSPLADVNVFDSTEETTKHDVTLRNFRIAGDGPNRTAGKGIRLYRCFGATVENVTIHRTREQGIEISGPVGLPTDDRSGANRLDNVFLDECGGDSVDINGDATDNFMHRVVVRRGQRNGIRIVTSANKLEACIVYSAAQGDRWLNASSTTIGEGYVFGGAGTMHNVLMGCEVDNCGRNGVYLTGGSFHQVIGCQAFNNGRHGVVDARMGIRVAHVTDCVFSSNVVNDTQGTPTQDGIVEAGSADRNLYLGNAIGPVKSASMTLAGASSARWPAA